MGSGTDDAGRFGPFTAAEYKARLGEVEPCAYLHCGEPGGCPFHPVEESAGPVEIGPYCSKCGTHIREQYYQDVARPFEVEAGRYHSTNRCAIAAGSAKAERARIVAWLRTDYAQNRNAQDFAEAIERGDYLKTGSR